MEDSSIFQNSMNLVFKNNSAGINGGAIYL